MPTLPLIADLYKKDSQEKTELQKWYARIPEGFSPPVFEKKFYNTNCFTNHTKVKKKEK